MANAMVKRGALQISADHEHRARLLSRRANQQDEESQPWRTRFESLKDAAMKAHEAALLGDRETAEERSEELFGDLWKYGAPDGVPSALPPLPPVQIEDYEAPESNRERQVLKRAGAAGAAPDATKAPAPADANGSPYRPPRLPR